MFRRRVASVIALAASAVVLLPLACASAPAAPPTTAEAPAAAIASASASAAPAVASASAALAPAAAAPPTCGEKEVLDAHGRCVTQICPTGQALASDGTCKAPPPCIDGEMLMGACICPHGKTVDETGHCAFSPCPPGTSGGTVFRNESGDCMECRPGTVPCGDHCCPGGGRKR